MFSPFTNSISYLQNLSKKTTVSFAATSIYYTIFYIALLLAYIYVVSWKLLILVFKFIASLRVTHPLAITVTVRNFILNLRRF